MGTLLALLVIICIIGIAYWAFSQIPLPPPMRIVANVVLALIAIVVLLQFVWPGHALHLR